MPIRTIRSLVSVCRQDQDVTKGIFVRDIHRSTNQKRSVYQCASKNATVPRQQIAAPNSDDSGRKVDGWEEKTDYVSLDGGIDGANFDWYKAWYVLTQAGPATALQGHAAFLNVLEWDRYPVAIDQELDPAVPHPVQLLGKSLVLWKPGGEEAWRSACNS